MVRIRYKVQADNYRILGCVLTIDRETRINRLFLPWSVPSTKPQIHFINKAVVPRIKETTIHLPTKSQSCHLIPWQPNLRFATWCHGNQISALPPDPIAWLWISGNCDADYLVKVSIRANFFVQLRLIPIIRHNQVCHCLTVRRGEDWRVGSGSFLHLTKLIFIWLKNRKRMIFSLWSTASSHLPPTSMATWSTASDDVSHRRRHHRSTLTPDMVGGHRRAEHPAAVTTQVGNLLLLLGEDESFTSCLLCWLCVAR